MIQQSRILKPITFENCRFNTLRLSKTEFFKPVNIFKCEFKESLSILNSYFFEILLVHGVNASNISIAANKFKSKFSISEYQCSGSLVLQFKQTGTEIVIQQYYKHFNITNNVHILFENQISCCLLISNINAKSVEINFSGVIIQNSLQISDLTAEECNIFSLKNKSDNLISFQRFIVGQLTVMNIHNDGLLRWTNVQAMQSESLRRLSIINSYLAKSEFYNVNLESFNSLRLFNCHLIDIIPINVKWNFNYSTYKDVTEENYLRELFRQLKMVCSKNMDKISSLRFEQMEMQFYNSQLTWKQNFGDWFILKTNRISNNHGQNWFLPLAWLVLFSTIFYFLIIYCEGSFKCVHIGNFLNFLTPFHSEKDITCGVDTHNGWITFWDILQKLFSSYFIFQFLRAFRKYVH